MGRKIEFCIVPPGEFWTNERQPGLVRHEIFFGPYRQKSIRLGLVVFLTPEMHNMSNLAVHNHRGNDLFLKRVGQRAAMDYYGWSTEEFISWFGKNYL
jgi:hypothetical protein